MLIIKTVAGFILVLIGSLMLLNIGLTWRDFGLWYQIESQGLSSIPLLIYLMPIIGLLLLSIGSFIIVMSFKGNLKCNDAVTFQSKPFLTFSIHLLILIQCCILFFQIHELSRYDKDIEKHMPAMSHEGNAEITGPFFLGTVKIPFFSQLILLPTVWGMLLYKARRSLKDAYTFLLSCLITSFSWCASMTAIIFAVGTYD